LRRFIAPLAGWLESACCRDPAAAPHAYRNALRRVHSPAQVQHLAAPPSREQIGEEQGAKTETGRGITRNDPQQPTHLLGAEPSGPGVGRPPRRADALGGVVRAQAFGAGPAVEAAQGGQLRGLGGSREPALVVSPPAPPIPGEEGFELRALRLQEIQAEDDQALEGVQAGVRAAPAGAEREVAGEVGQGQLLGENELARLPLSEGASGGGEWWPYCAGAGAGLSTAGIVAAPTNSD
jgi:hypothetical protein